MSIGQILKIAVILVTSFPELYKVFLKVLEVFKEEPAAKTAIKMLPEEPDAGAIQQSIEDYEKGALEYQDTLNTP